MNYSTWRKQTLITLITEYATTYHNFSPSRKGIDEELDLHI